MTRQSQTPDSTPKQGLAYSLEWIEETLIAYLLAGMTGVAFINVIARRVYNASLIWSLELTLFMFLLLVLFGMSYTARKSLHISVDVIADLFPKSIRRGIAVFAGIVSMIYAAMLTWGGYVAYSKFASNAALKRIATEELNIPRYVIYGVFTLAFIYLFITFAYVTWQIITGRKDSLTASHEAEDMVEEAKQAEDAKQGAL